MFRKIKNTTIRPMTRSGDMSQLILWLQINNWDIWNTGSFGEVTVGAWNMGFPVCGLVSWDINSTCGISIMSDGNHWLSSISFIAIGITSAIIHQAVLNRWLEWFYASDPRKQYYMVNVRGLTSLRLLQSSLIFFHNHIQLCSVSTFSSI